MGAKRPKILVFYIFFKNPENSYYKLTYSSSNLDNIKNTSEINKAIMQK